MILTQEVRIVWAGFGGTFQHWQDFVYGFSSLTLATRASADVKEWFFKSMSGEANQIFFSF